MSIIGLLDKIAEEIAKAQELAQQMEETYKRIQS